MLELDSILRALLVLVGLWVLHFFAWKKLVLDWSRQRLFSARDDLFMEAASGSVSFDHPAYGMLRMMMNSGIRAMSELTVSHVILAPVIFVILRPPRVHNNLDLQANFIDCVGRLAETNEEAAAVFTRYYQRMLTTMASYFMASSILVLAILLILGIALAITRGLGAMFKSFASVGKRVVGVSFALDEDAELEGLGHAT